MYIYLSFFLIFFRLSKEKSLNIQPGLKNLLENILVHDPEKRFSVIQYNKTMIILIYN